MDATTTLADANISAIDALLAMPTVARITTTDTPMSDAPSIPSIYTNPIIPRAPAITKFVSLSPEEQSTIYRTCHEISLAWSISSPASAFPYKYHPDPDPNNWGIGLLGAILRLAKVAKMDVAVSYVCHSIERENDGLSMVDGDWVIRREDVEYAFRRLRPRAGGESFRPEYGRGVRPRREGMARRRRD
ncbi:hypothetical protein CC86DRAFT_383377 [Ophiobolus disseminans]|uniref:Uncharacterized protein n=1 Tax=Ophiobolus disseminans TaxID=1469910 RepID=A0A6A6ZXE0_9PLEO|nr:hypothetical protein CC86DRAFT_383377 [Ophiobolus disseminans]